MLDVAVLLIAKKAMNFDKNIFLLCTHTFIHNNSHTNTTADIQISLRIFISIWNPIQRIKYDDFGQRKEYQTDYRPDFY